MSTLPSNKKRLLHPVGVDSGQTRINVKRCEGFDFGKIEKESLERIKFLKTEIDKREAQNLLKNGTRDDVVSSLGTLPSSNVVALSDETKFSFTIPPGAPSLLHIRFRINVDNKKGEWQNPLTWKDGSFFSPKMKVKLKSLSNIKRRQSSTSQDYVYRNPPPVIMSRSWERKNVVGLFKWQDQVVNPVEGELRIYTISGLTPSLEKGDTWSNWVFSSAGQGLYGTRTVEVQFASEVDERLYEKLNKAKTNGITKLQHSESGEFHDALSNSSDDDSDHELIEHEVIRKWEDIQEADWRMIPGLKYVVPSTDIFTTLLFIALNWGKSVGVKQMEEALIGQLDTNRARNTQVLKDFISEVMIKLEPVWENAIVPWLEKNPNLQFVLKEKRDEKLREKALEVMEILKAQSLIQDIPADFLSIRPNINSITVSVLDENGQIRQTMNASSTEGSTDIYDIPEGTSFRVHGKAQVSKFYRDHIADAVNTIRVREHTPELKLWWVILNESTGRYLEFSDGILRDTKNYINGPSKKIRKIDTSLLQDQDADNNEFKMFEGSSLIECNGLDRYGSILLESPCVLSIKLIAEEYGAHEDDIKEIRINFTHSLKPSSSDASLSSLVEGHSGKSNRIKRQASIGDTGQLSSVNPEAPVRRSPPSVFGGVETDDEIHDVFDRLRAVYTEGVQATGKTTVDEHMNDRWIIRSILEQLGHEPTEYDIEEAVTRLRGVIPEGKSILESEDMFIIWYKTTTFCKSMLVYTLDQLRETAILKRNEFLENKLKIPRNEWGFDPNEWGGLIPNGSFFVNHASGLAKWYMSDTWRKQLYSSTWKAPTEIAQNGQKKESKLDTVTSPQIKSIDLLDRTEIEKEEIRTVFITFLKSMTKERLSHTLPESTFESDEARREWICKNVPLDATLQEILAWKMLDYYAQFKANKPLRVENKKESEEKQNRVHDILNKPHLQKVYLERKFDTQVKAESADMDDITLFDIANVIGKDIVRHEVEMLVADLLPLLTATVSEQLFPAVFQGIFDYFRGLARRNLFKLAGICIASIGFYERKNIILLFDDIMK